MSFLQITVTYVVPPLVVFMAKFPLLDQYDLSSLRWIITGAAPLGQDILEAVAMRLGTKHVIQGTGPEGEKADDFRRTSRQKSFGRQTTPGLDPRNRFLGLEGR